MSTGWLIAMGLQAATAGPPALEMKAFHARPACPVAQSEDEITVCGRPDEPHRLKPLPEKYVREAALPKAEVGVGKAKLAAETESVGVGGFTSKRAMVRLKIPLGRQ